MPYSITYSSIIQMAEQLDPSATIDFVGGYYYFMPVIISDQAQTLFNGQPIATDEQPVASQVPGTQIGQYVFEDSSTYVDDVIGVDASFGSAGSGYINVQLISNPTPPPTTTLTIAAPSSATVKLNQATSVPEVSISEDGSGADEMFEVLLTDNNGLLSATGAHVSDSGTTSLDIGGTLGEVNSALATLTDTAPTGSSDTIAAEASDSLGSTVGPKNIAISVVGPLFTTGSDTVDFNNLSSQQQTDIAAGADFYHGLGGSDTVTLPREQNYSESVGNGQVLGWSDTSASTFYTGSTAGNTYRLSGFDGNYSIVEGAGTEIVSINGNGDSSITAGSGRDTVSIAGTGSTKIAAGSGILTASISGGGTLEIDGTPAAGSSFQIGANSALLLNSSIAQNETASFAGAAGTLVLASPGTFSGSIAGFAQGDVIDLRGAAPSSTTVVTYANGILKLGSAASLTVAGTDPIPTVALLSDGNGGTDVETVALPTLLDLSFDTYNAVIAPEDGYNEYDSTTDAGFAADAFVEPGTGNGETSIVIAFRGTDTANWISFTKNLVADLSVATGALNAITARYVQDAVAFVQEVQARATTAFSNPEIVLTGHSLGGALAQAVGAGGGFAAAAFDAPGSLAIFNQAQAQGLFTPVAGIGSGGTDINYRLNGDQISEAGTPLGQTYTIASPYASNTPVSAIANLLNNHGVGSAGYKAAFQNLGIAGDYTQGTTGTNIAGPLASAVAAAGGIGLHIQLQVVAAVASIIDPPGGTMVSLTGDAASPNMSAITLPFLPGVGSYQVSYRTGTTWSTPSTVAPNTVDSLPNGVSGVQFASLDALGNPVAIPPGFLFTITFAANGTFTGALNVTGASIPAAQPVAAATTRTVAANAGATFIGIGAPTDAAYSNAAMLTASIASLPANGLLVLGDGVTAATVGDSLTIPQLEHLEFAPAAAAANTSSAFTYDLADPDIATGMGTVTLNVVAALPPATIENPDGTSSVYVYNPTTKVSETVTNYGGANATGKVTTEIVDNDDGTSYVYAYNPTSTVIQTTQSWSATNASTGTTAGNKLADVVNFTNGTSYVYAYNPTSTVKQTAELWSVTNPDGSAAGSRIADVVNNNDGTTLVYAYNPTSTVTQTTTNWNATNADGSSAGTETAAVVDNTNGTAIVYAFNPTSSVTLTATFYPGYTVSTGAPTGSPTSITADYTNNQSAITSYTGGSASTIYYSGPNGTGSAILGPVAGSFNPGPPVSGSSLTVTSAAGIAGDDTITTISGSGQTIDPGPGNHAIQFITGASNDTLVLHMGGTDTISGFDPSAGDTLDLRTLFAEAQVDIATAMAALPDYVSVAADGGSAEITFDPTGHGGGVVVAPLTHGGALVPRLQTGTSFVV